MSQQEVVEYMQAATSEEDWNHRTDEVKRRFGGYPDFWFAAIVQGGVMATAQMNWTALAN